MPVDREAYWTSTGEPPLILSLSGGGFRGYYTAQVLAAVERRLGAPCNKIFNLIAGTSIGGIIALALANGVPAAEIVRIIKAQGESIFPPLKLVGLRRMWGPPYNADGLRTAFRSLLAARHTQRLGASSTRVMVVAASAVLAKTVVIRSWDQMGTGEMSTLDAALATSAAPTYFPAYKAKIGPAGQTVELIDGGIAANAPDALALHHAVTELGFPEQMAHIFSVGTCGRAQGGISGPRANNSGMGGTLLSLGGRGIIDLMMAVQEQRGIAEAEARVGSDRFLRIDRTPNDSQAKHLGLDDAGSRARSILEELASATAQELDSLSSNAVWRLMTARSQA